MPILKKCNDALVLSCKSRITNTSMRVFLPFHKSQALVYIIIRLDGP